MIESWLELLCQCLPGVTRAVVVRSRGAKIISKWPSDISNEYDSEFLAQKLAKNEDALIHRRLDKDTIEFYQPLHTKGVHFASLMIECKVADAQVDALKQLLMWSETWLELLANQNRKKNSQSDQLLEVLEKASSHEELAKNAYAFCSHLASKLPLTQSVFCTCLRDKVEVVAVSKTPDYDRRTQPFEQLVIYLEGLLSGEANSSKDLYDQWLLRNNPGTGYQAFPLIYDGEVFAYLTVFFPSKSGIDTSVSHQIELFLRYLSPIYFRSFWADLSFVKKVTARASRFVQESSKSKRRMLYLAASAVLLALAIFPVHFKIKAEAHLEGRIQRAIVVPEDGYLQDVFVKTGEQIQKNQVIAVLDEKSIRLEVQRWKNEKEEYEREYNRELTALNHVQMRIAQSKIAQAQAKLSIYLDRLKKVRIVSPIDGIVIKGDLSRAIGAPVKQGQVLYEIAPNNQFKLVLLVGEQDIVHLQKGLPGSLQLAAFPSETITFQISAISSVFEENARKLQYRVEAELKGSTTGLRPGMTGVGKVVVGKRSWFYVLTRPVLEWLRVWWWSLL